MSKPVISDLFSFRARRNRQSYLLCLMANVVMLVPVASLMQGDIGFRILGAPTYFALLLAAAAVSVQRLHDLNVSGAFAVLLLVPVANLVLLLVLLLREGTPVANRYGIDPLGPSPLQLG